MLESLRDCPPCIGRDLSPAAWARSIAGNLAVTALTLALCWLGHALLVVRCGLSPLSILLSWAATVVAITAWLYVYYVYIVDAAGSSSSSSGSGRGRGDSTSSKSPKTAAGDHTLLYTCFLLIFSPVDRLLFELINMHVQGVLTNPTSKVLCQNLQKCIHHYKYSYDEINAITK